MKKIIEKYAFSEAATAALEFALVAPILILLIIGTVDIGMYIMERMRLQDVAHASAEYVVQAQDDSNLLIVAEESYRGDFEDITITSEFSCECSDGVAQECPVSCGGRDYQRRFVAVTASGSFNALFPYPGLPESMPMQRSVRMRVD